MKCKTFILSSIAGIFLLLFSACIIVHKVDPYLQYHAPNDTIAYSLDTNSFASINAGIVKNYSYDTIITGSSMSRSFLPSYIDKQFQCSTVKLSMAEARGKDFHDLLPFVTQNKNLKRIIMGLDTFAFTVDKDFSSYDKPLYLYDHFLLNDMLYLANMDGLVKSYDALKFTASGGKTTSMDEYQNYAFLNTFSKEKVLEIYKNNIPVTKTEFDEQQQTAVITENLSKNLLPVIKKNPQIDFLFYFPPYSIVKWGLLSNIESELHAMQIIMELLLPYDNVSIYFPQGDTEIITDLDQYMDTIHFNSDVANRIIDEMQVDENKLTTADYLQRLDAFRQFVTNYDYDSLLDTE